MESIQCVTRYRVEGEILPRVREHSVQVELGDISVYNDQPRFQRTVFSLSIARMSLKSKWYMTILVQKPDLSAIISVKGIKSGINVLQQNHYKAVSAHNVYYYLLVL